MMHQSTILILSGIGLLGIASQWLAWKLKLPAILFLLIAGIMYGPVTGTIHPDRIFGHLLFPLASLAVAVILFEGALGLKLNEIRELQDVVRNLVSYGTLISGTITATASHYIAGLTWTLSALFGAMMTVTGPTVITPILRSIRPKASVATVLRWEGSVIDPVGALLSVLVFDFIVSQGSNSSYAHVFLIFAQIIAVGIGIGSAAGFALGILLRNHWIPEYLHNFITLMWVFGAFSISNTFAPESGMLAVTIMGAFLANMDRVPVESIIDFKESLSITFISALFIILAARLQLLQIQAILWESISVLLIIQFVSRPIKVFFSTIHSNLSWQEKTLIAWIGPRGIIAAAVSTIFSQQLQTMGIPQSNQLVPLTFMIIIGTVLLESISARPLAKLLGVSEPEPNGLLIVGANPIARQIALALKKHNISIILADSQWDYIRTARMEGIPTYFGNPISEHADRHLDLVGIGKLLGLSPHKELNALAARYYSREFGKQNVFVLRNKKQTQIKERKHGIAASIQGNFLFGPEASYRSLSTLIHQGAEIRSTKLTKTFSYSTWSEQNAERAIPLFIISPKGDLKIFSDSTEIKVPPDSTIIALYYASSPSLIQPEIKQPITATIGDSSDNSHHDL